MPKILVVEDDWGERDMVLNNIRTGLPRADVSAIMNAGELLLMVQEDSDLGGVCVVVMEHHLPLWTIGNSEEELDSALNRLQRDFPDVVKDWDGQQAGERLVRWMRSIGVQVPVIIYTHSDESRIAEDVRALPNVSYCVKGLEAEPLIDAINVAMRTR